MAWAKMHTDMLGDLKLRRAAKAGTRDLELLPWLILFAKQQDDDGRLSVGDHRATPQEIAELLPGVRPKRVEACENALVAMGILTPDYDGVLRFTNWSARQGKASDSKEAVAERVKRHRLRRQQRDGVVPAVTPKRGVTVTPKTRVTVTQEERRGEERREEDCAPLPGAPPAGNWPGTLAAVLTQLGPVSPGKLGRDLKPFVDGLAPEQRALLGRAAECYVRWYRNLAPEKASYEKHPESFVKRAGYWLEQVRPLTPEEAEKIA